MANGANFENTLERLLIEASESPAARPRFYRELLHSQILICPAGDLEGADDPARATATLRLASIPHDGIAYVPFYLAEKFLPPGVRYIALPAKTFFEITKGSHLVLNPGAQFGKTFTPDEMAKVTAGELLDVEKEFQVSNNAEVLIGAPKDVPPQLREQLARFFDAEDAVLRGWLGWYHNVESEKQPGYLLGIETTRSADFRSLAGRVSFVLKEVGTGGHYCDIVQCNGRGLTRYFRSARPFYAKPFWRRLTGAMLG